MIIPKIILVTPSYLENWARRCMTRFISLSFLGNIVMREKKEKVVCHSLIATGEVGIRGSLYLRNSR